MFSTLPFTPASIVAAPGSANPRFRTELQGLRAFAILLVVIYHVWVGRVSGGVDTFLLISTFLMTLAMMRRIDSGREVRLRQQWGHLFRRLMPAAVVTIGATLLIGALVIPAVAWPQLWTHGWSSLFYAENWRLIIESVDYYAPSHLDRSPFQHFWSLSMQGQVFIVWPALFFLATRVGRLQSPVLARRRLIVAFGAIFVVSLAWSVLHTAISQEIAYFDTFARLWEFALGSLLALFLGERKLTGLPGVIAGWVGIIGLISCGIVIDVAGAFPGVAAFWPLVSAALIICAGQTNHWLGVDRFLSHPTAVQLGSWSYGLYLAHWPVLVYWVMIKNDDDIGVLDGSAIIAISLTIAWLLTRFVDGPVRQWRWPEGSTLRAWLVVVACVASVAVPLMTWQTVTMLRANAQELSAHNPGARSLEPGFAYPSTNKPVRVIPDPALLDGQWVDTGELCATDLAEAVDTDYCWLVRSSKTATRRVLAIGASHMQQFIGTVKPLAESYDWDLYLLSGGACGLGVYPGDQGEFCEDLTLNRLQYALDAKPDTVLLIGTTTYADDREERIPDHVELLIGGLLDEGVEVIAFRDNPRFPFAPTMCLLEGGDDDDCSRQVDDFYASVSPLAEYGPNPLFHEVYLGDEFCPDGVCAPVIGNVYVYFDSHHFTRLYAESVSDFVERQLQASGFPF